MTKKLIVDLSPEGIAKLRELFEKDCSCRVALARPGGLALCKRHVESFIALPAVLDELEATWRESDYLKRKVEKQEFDLIEAKRRLDNARETLRLCGPHRSYCASLTPRYRESGCTCGLDEALGMEPAK